MISYYNPNNYDPYILMKDAMALEPAFDYLVRHLEPNTAGCANSACLENITTSNYLFLLILFIYCFILASMFFVYIRQFRLVKPQLTASTIKLHQNIFFALILQAIFTILFMIVPLLVLNFSFILRLKHGSLYAMLTFFYVSIHTSLEILSTLIIIKPYRIFIKSILVRVPVFKKILKSSTTITVTFVVPISSVALVTNRI